jgi:hypothetical protein
MAATSIMNQIKTPLLWSFIVFLCFSAFLGIVGVLSGDFGEFQAKVLATTSITALASICGLCCSAYCDRRTFPLAGQVGVILAIAFAVMVVIGIWGDVDDWDYWRVTLTMMVYGIAVAHMLALLLLRLPGAYAWLYVVTGVLILLLSSVIVGIMFAEDGNEGIFKLLAVLAILTALGTLVIPVVSRLTRDQLVAAVTAERGPRLILSQRPDGLYEDAQGPRYTVSLAEALDDCGSDM